MLGIVFTEFAEMVEQEFSPDLLDDLLTNLEDDLPSNGVYTAVGKYDHTEMLQLVGQLSKAVDIPLPDLVRTYGRHLFGRFTIRYPMFFEDVSDSFDFLERVETHIHSEVHKLYETSELPKFNCTRTAPNALTMEYRSERPFAQLAYGLIEGCANHFGENLAIAYADLSGGDMTHARFDIARS